MRRFERLVNKLQAAELPLPVRIILYAIGGIIMGAGWFLMMTAAIIALGVAIWFLFLGGWAMLLIWSPWAFGGLVIVCALLWATSIAMEERA